MRARHPKRQRLQRWLDTGEPRRVSHHIERCVECQEQLEELSALDEGLVADLQAATDPPDDLRARTHGGVDVRLHDEAVFGAFTDLFAIAWDFTRGVLDPEFTDRGEAHHGQAPTDGTDGGAA
jgi:hypothetical protein